MASLTNTIPEKDHRTVERIPPHAALVPQTGHHAHLLACSGRHPRHHGRTGAPRPDADIGFSSDTKKGYDVQVLIEYISNILDSPSPMNIAVLGMGHLGQAITKYFNGKGLNLKITAAFDVDPEKVGKTIDGIPVLPYGFVRGGGRGEGDLDRHRLVAHEGGAEPRAADHQRRNQGGAQLHLHAPELPAGIIVENYDITTLLEKVAYFVKENEENSNT